MWERHQEEQVQGPQMTAAGMHDAVDAHAIDDDEDENEVVGVVAC